MTRKISPVIIIVILLVVLALGILIFSMLNSDNNNSGENNNTSESIIKPTLNLSLDSSEENQEKVVISAQATMEDGSNIKTIILPDGGEVLASETTYEVTENGEYSFKAIAENGEETVVTITVSNIKIVSSKEPYIPTGFSAVEGTEEENGFEIEDEYGNKYVWVPLEKGQLIRDTILNTDYEEETEMVSEFLKSVSENFGFYVAKYEASEYEINGEKVAATIGGKAPWTNVTFIEAVEYAKLSAEEFGYDGYKTSVINSYAWDTILKWFDESVENYSTNLNYGNYSGSIYPTGSTQSDTVYNICDIAGNVREWTTEIYLAQENEDYSQSRVVRGGSASLSRTPKSHTGYPENTFDEYWGFRMILYK